MVVGSDEEEGKMIVGNGRRDGWLRGIDSLVL